MNYLIGLNNMEQKMNEPKFGGTSFSGFSPFASTTVSNEEISMLRLQVKVLESLMEDYGHKTLSNVLEGLKKRIECLTNKNK